MEHSGTAVTAQRLAGPGRLRPELRLVAPPAPDPYDVQPMARQRRAEPDPSLLQAGLIPLALVLLFFLIYAAQLPFFTAAILACPPILLFFAAPFWARRSVARFDRDAVHLLTTARVTDLDRRFGRAIGMRLFAPGALVAERRGMVAAEQGRPGEARRAYRKAMRGYEESEHAPVSVQLGYAHASYTLGDDPEAVLVYRRLLAVEGALPGVRRNLAHALIRTRESLREALGLLEAARREVSTEAARAEITLMEALGEARLGNRATAKSLSARVGDVDTPLGAELRVELDAELAPSRRRKRRKRS